MSEGRYAFATLVTSDGYLPGALNVAAALREVHPRPPVEPEVPFKTVCIVTPETVDINTIKHLRKAFDIVFGVEVIEEETSAELELLGKSCLTLTHTSRIFGLWPRNELSRPPSLRLISTTNSYFSSPLFCQTSAQISCLRLVIRWCGGVR